MRKIVFLSFACLLFSGGCSQIEPFVDSRREAGQVQRVGRSTKDRIAVCYNSWISDKKEIEALAAQACAETGREAVFLKEEAFMCRLVTPRISYFDCVPKKKK